MTRETKVGLVVSCSFLGLIAAVVTLKLREPPPDAAPSGPELARVEPAARELPAPTVALPGPAPTSPAPAAPAPFVEGNASEPPAISPPGGGLRPVSMEEKEKKEGEKGGKDGDGPTPPSIATSPEGGSKLPPVPSSPPTVVPETPRVPEVPTNNPGKFDKKGEGGPAFPEPEKKAEPAPSPLPPAVPPPSGTVPVPTSGPPPVTGPGGLSEPPAVSPAARPHGDGQPAPFVGPPAPDAPAPASGEAPLPPAFPTPDGKEPEENGKGKKERTEPPLPAPAAPPMVPAPVDIPPPGGKVPEPTGKSTTVPEPKAPDLGPPTTVPPPGGSTLPPLGKGGREGTPSPAAPPAVPAPTEKSKPSPPGTRDEPLEHSHWIDKTPTPRAVTPPTVASPDSPKVKLTGAAPMGVGAPPPSPLQGEPPAAATPVPPPPVPPGRGAAAGPWTSPAGDLGPPAEKPAASPGPTADPMPPLGTVPTAVTPPLRVFPPNVAARPLPGAAAVESYDETSRTIRPADLGAADARGNLVDPFVNLSKECYNSPDFAEALKLWNRYHPRATQAMRSEGRLVAGDRIYVPPVSMLEKRYGSVISHGLPTGGTAGRTTANPGTVPASFPPSVRQP